MFSFNDEFEDQIRAVQICLVLVVEESLNSGLSKRSQRKDSSDLPGTGGA